MLAAIRPPAYQARPLSTTPGGARSPNIRPVTSSARRTRPATLRTTHPPSSCMLFPLPPLLAQRTSFIRSQRQRHQAPLTRLPPGAPVKPRLLAQRTCHQAHNGTQRLAKTVFAYPPAPPTCKSSPTCSLNACPAKPRLLVQRTRYKRTPVLARTVLAIRSPRSLNAPACARAPMAKFTTHPPAPTHPLPNAHRCLATHAPPSRPPSWAYPELHAARCTLHAARC